MPFVDLGDFQTHFLGKRFHVAFCPVGIYFEFSFKLLNLIECFLMTRFCLVICVVDFDALLVILQQEINLFVHVLIVEDRKVGKHV